MSSVRLWDASFAFPQQHSLITACTLEFGAGWTGIVGKNGCGKSTLLDLIDGTRAPSSGRVERGGLRIARVPQSPAVQEDVSDFANAYTSAALRWMSLLELDPGDYWRWQELSPGMRRRWQIGAALFEDPGALLLDEPTNHLDAQGKDLLVQTLRRYAGVGIVVSHDRELLDAICASTVRLRSGQARRYAGAYSAARAAWEAESERELVTLEAAQDHVRALRAQVAERKRRHASAASSLSSRSRMKSVRDSDARGLSAKFRAQRAEAAIGRGRGIAQAELERAEAALDALARPDGAVRGLFVQASMPPVDVIVTFEARPLRLGDRVLADDVALTVRRGERHWLRGPNGCGKTTLLRQLVASSGLAQGRLLWIPQVQDGDGVRAQFEELAADARARALQIAVALGLDVRPLLDGTALSPGQLRKVAVAIGLVREPWLVILDEPTNDLDLDAIEALEAALAEYPGALLVVTHDARFAATLGLEPLDLFAG